MPKNVENMVLTDKKAPIYVIIAGVLWGITGVFSTKLSSFGLMPIQITEIRCIISSVCIGIYLCIKDRKKLEIDIKDIWMFLGTGVLSIAFFNICYFTCVNLTSISLAAILLYTAPCFVMVLSCILFKEKLTTIKIAALLMAFAGCGAVAGIFSKDMKMSALGFAVGIGAGFGYCLYSIFGNIALKKYNTITINFYTFLIAGTALLPFCHIFDIFKISFSGTYTLANALSIGVLNTLIPFMLYTKGLSSMEAGKASTLAFVEPMTATIIGILFYNEEITIMKLAGITLIIMSVILLGNQGKKE